MKIVSAGEFNRAGRRQLFPLRSLGLLGFALCATLNLAAQNAQTWEGSGAIIYHVDGVDFSLSLGGKQTVFPAGAVGGGGVKLEQSGIVNTGAGTFLEIQLVPSGTVIKLSENTSLIYNGFDGNGKFTDLGLLYGRIRVVTGNGTSPDAVIRCEGVSARIREGDFGVDYLLEPDNRNSSPRPLFRLYAFRGGSEVFSYGRGNSPAFFGGARSLSVAEGECLFLDVSPSYTYAEKKALGGDISDYWRLHNFSGGSPFPLPATIIALPSAGSSPALSGGTAAAVPDQTAGTGSGQRLMSYKSYSRNKNAALAVGLFLTASAVAVQGICYSRFNTANDEQARNYYNAAYIPLGLGLLTTLVGILYNPLPSSR